MSPTIYICLLVSSSVFVTRVTAQTGLCRFGNTAGCVFPCHCTKGCYQTTGACIDGGECEWDDPAIIRRAGPGCKLGNIAKGRPAYQSGQHDNLVAALAVDGDIRTWIRYCAHPDAGTGHRAWWYLDLGETYTVVSVTILNRENDQAYERTGNFRLGVGSVTDGDLTSVCKNYTGIVPRAGSDTIYCDPPLSGRYVTIIRNAGGYQVQYLALCEVIVHGYKPIVCDRNRCQSCDPIIGCGICPKNYPKYPDCQECDKNHFGINCNNQCSSNCLIDLESNSRSCSVTDGRCTSGCQDLYFGDQCQDKCSNGCHVVNGSNVCHRGTGDCKNGCRNGHYSKTCNETCSVYCNGVNGISVCARNNGTCSKGCLGARWGAFCETECSSGCKPLNQLVSGSCNQWSGICNNGCQDGFYGEFCNKSCNNSCAGEHSIPGCDRYSGACVCHSGYYGKTCDQPCSSNCEAVDNITTCHQDSGACSNGCHLPPYKTWYAGDHCTQSIAYVEYPDINKVSFTDVKTDRITFEWAHVNAIPLNTSAVFGYKITVSEANGADIESLTIEINEDNIAMKYDKTLSNLAVNSTYRITLKIYRQLTGIKEDCLKNTTVFATTLATQEQEPSVGPSISLGLIGPITGSVAAFLTIAILVVILVVFLRKRRTKAKDDANAKMEEIPPKGRSYSSFRRPSDNELAETQVVKEVDNPCFGGNVDENPNTIYYDFPATKRLEEGTCVKEDDLEVYIGARKYTKDGLKKEFEDVPNGELSPCDVAKQTQNIARDRFKNIRAYDFSRVVLETTIDNSDYINASFITGYPNKKNHYVATQGPKPLTVYALWSMVWQLESNRIVMATRIKELTKTKCAQYWPEAVGEVVTYDDITVTTTACDSYADYTLTLITIRKGNERRTVKHLQFLSWPDKEAPEHVFPLLQFRRKLRSFDGEGTGPIIVHCSAGIGRTGTLIALDYLLDQMKREGKVDVFKLVTQLRNERMEMVQTLPQYIFIYEALLDAYQQGQTAIPCNVYPERFTQLVGGNEYSNEIPIEEQFKILSKMKQHKESDDKLSALSKENRRKNRDADIVPDNKHRLYLSTRCPGTNDYINAVVVNSFLAEKTFIATQLPLPDTVVDLWRLVYEQNCHTVITVDTTSPNSEDCPNYWDFQQGDVRKFGDLEVRIDSKDEDEKDAIEERKFTVSFSSSNKALSVRHILFKQRPDKQNLPNMDDTLNLLERLQKWQRQSEAGKIVIQCKDGASHSGMICAAHYMLEKMKEDREVDVFLAVRVVSLHRQQFVNTLDQYRFLHCIAMEYITRNEQYGNFK